MGRRDRMSANVGPFVWAIAVVLFAACWSSATALAQGYLAKDLLAGLGKDPSIGAADAPVTITEFSDFQCGYCKKFWAETLPKLKESYIETGKARFVYRHFAIFGKPSQAAAEASVCAGEQNKFWPYHDKLFSNLGKGFVAEKNLKKIADEIKLEPAEFARCLQSTKIKEKVERETMTASYLGGRGTPMFFVNEKLLIGAQPFEVFQQVIEAELKAVAQPKKKSPAK
ncbi:MAG: DsbA family protein [Deltaproteobacteria bacterium]|nr:DsbA family protein [Deltaproteobacteria bacterium]MBM4299312.1 DsbA family protein [Deltaproteobacteria bacterium]